MNARVSPEAAEYIRGRGGRVFVWAGAVCCGGTRFVESGLAPPGDSDTFVPLTHGGITVLIRAVNGAMPDELEITLGGLLRKRVIAYWNGCPYLP